MSRQPLFFMLLAFCFGIVFRDYVHASLSLMSFALAVSGILLMVPLFWPSRFLIKARTILLSLFFIALGYLVHDFNVQKSQQLDVKGRHTIVFELEKKLNSNENYRKYQIRVFHVQKEIDNGNGAFSIVLQVPKDGADLDFLHYYKADVFFTPIQSTAFDFQFNYGNYLDRQKVVGIAFANSEIFVAPKQRITVPDYIRQFRYRTLKRINQSRLYSKNQEFLKGIVLADRTEMDSGTVSDFNRSGLVHFLAISGSHMLVIFWLVLLIVSRLFSIKYRKARIIVALVIIWLFAIFIDYGNSVVRSCIMISLYYISGLLNRKSHVLQSVAVSGFIILCWDSQQFFDVGFQLSYTAVLGIYWLYQPLVGCFPKVKSRLLTFFIGLFSLSLAAQISTLPIVLYYFHQYSFVSILSNLCIIPFSEVIIVFSVLMTVLFSFDIELSVVDFLYNGLIDIMLAVIHWFAEMQVLMFDQIGLSLIEVAFAFLIIYYLRFVLVSRRLNSFLNFGFALLLFLAVQIFVTFYYVSKKEVVVVKSYKSKVIFIKKGGAVTIYSKAKKDKEKVTRFVIEPYLIYNRVNKSTVEWVGDEVTGIYYQGVFYDMEP